MHKTLAQVIHIGKPGDPDVASISGPLKLPGGVDVTIGNLVSVILTNFVLPAASIVLLFVIIWAGYGFLTSRGEPEKLKAARAKITYGILGFVLLAISYFIVNVISYIFGFGRELF